MTNRVMVSHSEIAIWASCCSSVSVWTFPGAAGSSSPQSRDLPHCHPGALRQPDLISEMQEGTAGLWRRSTGLPMPPNLSSGQETGSAAGAGVLLGPSSHTGTLLSPSNSLMGTERMCLSHNGI